MSERTKIEWADSTWSPWRGCTKWSEGCAHCYAETQARRNPKVLGEWGPGAPRVKNKDWQQPRRWNKRLNPLECENAIGERFKVSFARRKVFPSFCDWLDDEVPIHWLAEFMALIHDTPNLDWLLLTKRPENWRSRINDVSLGVPDPTRREGWEVRQMARRWVEDGTPPSNVWFGVSVENQNRADERIPILLDIPANLRWLSLEPLLGPVDVEQNYWLTGEVRRKDKSLCPPGTNSKLDWLVIGGESGPGARPCKVEWIRSLLHQGTSAGVPVFVKQLGGVCVDRNDAGFEGDSGPRGWPMDTDTDDSVEPGVYQGKPVRVILRDKKGGDLSEWPEDLRVRQMPLSRSR